jgi:hypothetical protein
MIKAYPEVQGKAVDELLSAAPPAGMTRGELERWYNGAMQYLAEIEAEVGPALYQEPAIENDYEDIRRGN